MLQPYYYTYNFRESEEKSYLLSCLPDNIANLLKTFYKYNYTAYLYKYFIRKAFLNPAAKLREFNIITNAPPLIVEEILKENGIEEYIINKFSIKAKGISIECDCNDDFIYEKLSINHLPLDLILFNYKNLKVYIPRVRSNNEFYIYNFENEEVRYDNQIKVANDFLYGNITGRWGTPIYSLDYISELIKDRFIDELAYQDIKFYHPSAVSYRAKTVDIPDHITDAYRLADDMKIALDNLRTYTKSMLNKESTKYSFRFQISDFINNTLFTETEVNDRKYDLFDEINYGYGFTELLLEYFFPLLYTCRYKYTAFGLKEDYYKNAITLINSLIFKKSIYKECWYKDVTPYEKIAIILVVVHLCEALSLLITNDTSTNDAFRSDLLDMSNKLLNSFILTNNVPRETINYTNKLTSIVYDLFKTYTKDSMPVLLGISIDPEDKTSTHYLKTAIHDIEKLYSMYDVKTIIIGFIILNVFSNTCYIRMTDLDNINLGIIDTKKIDIIKEALKEYSKLDISILDMCSICRIPTTYTVFNLLSYLMLQVNSGAIKNEKESLLVCLKQYIAAGNLPPVSK